MSNRLNGSKALAAAQIERINAEKARVTIPEYDLSFVATRAGNAWRLSKFQVDGFNLTSTYSNPSEDNVLNHVTLLNRLNRLTDARSSEVREAAAAVKRAQDELANAQRKLADAQR